MTFNHQMEIVSLVMSLSEVISLSISDGSATLRTNFVMNKDGIFAFERMKVTVLTAVQSL